MVSSADTPATGMISAGDLNPQKARMVLSLALASGLEPVAIATLIASVQ